MAWKDNEFPEADDPAEVEWMIMYWRTVPCPSGRCHSDYRLESRQFDHMVKATTREEALEKFNAYVENRKESGEQPSTKNHVLFLCRVDTMIRISDETGRIV